MYWVVWVPEALDELTNIWLEADTSLRHSITAACHQIDQRLRTNLMARGSHVSAPNASCLLTR
jgi:hypothetical protein